MSVISDRIRKTHRTFCSAVVLAAGSSERFGEDKLTALLCGTPVLARTLRALDACDCIHEIVLVAAQERIDEAANLCRDYNVKKVTRVVCGGATRAESALAGVCEIDRRAKLVAIHDGDRPLVTEELVYAAVHTAALHKAAAPAVPVCDTVKIAEGGSVAFTPDRRDVTAVQTPQVFIPELINAALTDAIKKGVQLTDDCSAAERLGIPVRLTQGSPENIKITTPLDLDIAETILRKREGSIA